MLQNLVVKSFNFGQVGNRRIKSVSQSKQLFEINYQWANFFIMAEKGPHKKEVWTVRASKEIPSLKKELEASKVLLAENFQVGVQHF